MSEDQQETPERATVDLTDWAQQPDPTTTDQQPELVTGEPTKAAPPELTEQAVLDFIGANPRTTILRIAEFFGVERGPVVAHTTQLKDASKIRTVGSEGGYGVFVVTGSDADPGKRAKRYHSAPPRAFNPLPGEEGSA